MRPSHVTVMALVACASGFGSMPSTPSMQECVDDPMGILAADTYLDPNGQTCESKMGSPANCDTADSDYNGYSLTYSQLCPLTCGTCDTWVRPECTRRAVCCCG